MAVKTPTEQPAIRLSDSEIDALESVTRQARRTVESTAERFETDHEEQPLAATIEGRRELVEGDLAELLGSVARIAHTVEQQLPLFSESAVRRRASLPSTDAIAFREELARSGGEELVGIATDLATDPANRNGNVGLLARARMLSGEVGNRPDLDSDTRRRVAELLSHVKVPEILRKQERLLRQVRTDAEWTLLRARELGSGALDPERRLTLLRRSAS